MGHYFLTGKSPAKRWRITISFETDLVSTMLNPKGPSILYLFFGEYQKVTFGFRNFGIPLRANCQIEQKIAFLFLRVVHHRVWGEILDLACGLHQI